MFKNVILGIVLTAISAGLVYGAITRTELRETTAAARNTEGNTGNGSNGGNSGQGGRNQDETSTGNGNRDGSGNGRGGSSASNGVPVESALADVDETVQFEGVTSEVTEDHLIVDTVDGNQIVIENRAWWYALEAGFSTTNGDEIIAVGFYDDDGVFEVISLENLTQGTEVQVREDSGRPLWAGNGNSGNGNGNR